MNASTESTDWHQERGEALSRARQWLGALSRGTCAVAEVLNGIDALVRGDPESAWDVLAVVDQSYRLGKIDAAAYQELNSHVVRLALGANGDLLRRRPPSDAPATAPRLLNRTVPVTANPARADVDSTPPTVAQPVDGAREPIVGDVLRGRYEITGLLGRGGMGTVFEAVDLDEIGPGHTPRPLALKVLHPSVTRRPELFAELRREFQNLQSLSHPNIVRVHAFDRDAATAFFTMELLRGMPLAKFLAAAAHEGELRRRGPAIIDAIGNALAHAHQRGIVHGDVNPENVFLTRDGDLRVLDFGASRRFALGAQRESAAPPPLLAAAAPGFASCQVLAGEPADVRDDLFAFGCIVYLLLTGKPPYGDLTALEARDIRAIPRRPPQLCDEPWQVLLEALAFDRDARPADIRDWLARWNATRSPPAPSAAPAAALAPAAPAAAAPAPAEIAERLRPRATGARHLKVALSSLAIALLGLFAWWGTRSGAQFARPRATETRSTNSGVPRTATAPSTPAPPTPSSLTPSAARAPQPAPALSPESSPPPAALTGPPAPPASPPVATASRPDAAIAAHAHVALAEAYGVVDPRDPAAIVSVVRNGSPEGVASFTWWTAAGSAKAGVDFDNFTPRVAKFPAGVRRLDLRIPMHFGGHRAEAKNFYVMIAPSAPDFSPVTRHTTMIKIKAAR